jgi:hypothetical protein
VLHVNKFVGKTEKSELEIRPLNAIGFALRKAAKIKD